MDATIKVYYKTENGPEYAARLEEEFNHKIDPLLRGFLFCLSSYTRAMSGICITLTSLVRSPIENEADHGIPLSAHLFGRAGDIRTWAFTTEQIETMVKWVQDNFGDMVYIVYHNAGSGKHLHVNINRAYARKFTEVVYADYS